MSATSSDPTTAAEQFVFDADWYENSELRQLPRLLAGVQTFVDVGASVGPYTRAANQYMRGGRIVAVEANPATYERLAANCGTWAAASTNRIEPIAAAVGQSAGTAELFIPGTDELPLVSSLLRNEDVARDWRTVEVECVTLDTLVGAASPDLIKIDVEGAECRVLQGSHAILTAGHCRFLVEIHPWGDPAFGRTPADVFRLMHGYGYDFERVSRHWHFRRSGSTITRKLKYVAMMLIQRNLWIKQQLVKIVLALDKRRNRQTSV